MAPLSSSILSWIVVLVVVVNRGRMAGKYL
jgi:hypothetical protein